MKIRRGLTVIAIPLAMLFVASPAMGSIIYDNGGPSSLSVPSDLDELTVITDISLPLIIADDFVLDDDMILTDVHWWGTYWLDGSPTPATDDFRVELFAGEPDGTPATSPLASFAVGDIGRTDTGNTDFQGNAIYAYSVDLDTPVALAGGTEYYLSVVNNTANSTALWAWSATDSLDNLGYFLRNEDSEPWVATVVPSNFAFNLTGTVVPEPASFTLIGLGLAAIALRRRRTYRRLPES